MNKTIGDGREWSFVGIWAKNRWEWLATYIANMYMTTTTIGFFDSMSADNVDFIVKQTELTSVFCAGEYVDKVLQMKKSGLAQSIQNLISFEEVNEN